VPAGESRGNGGFGGLALARELEAQLPVDQEKLDRAKVRELKDAIDAGIPRKTMNSWGEASLQAKARARAADRLLDRLSPADVSQAVFLEVAEYLLRSINDARGFWYVHEKFLGSEDRVSNSGGKPLMALDAEQARQIFAKLRQLAIDHGVKKDSLALAKLSNHVKSFCTVARDFGSQFPSYSKPFDGTRDSLMHWDINGL
jgi:hypothetical protein